VTACLCGAPGFPNRHKLAGHIQARMHGRRGVSGRVLVDRGRLSAGRGDLLRREGQGPAVQEAYPWHLLNFFPLPQ